MQHVPRKYFFLAYHNPFLIEGQAQLYRPGVVKMGPEKQGILASMYCAHVMNLHPPRTIHLTLTHPPHRQIFTFQAYYGCRVLAAPYRRRDYQEHILPAFQAMYAQAISHGEEGANPTVQTRNRRGKIDIKRGTRNILPHFVCCSGQTARDSHETLQKKYKAEQKTQGDPTIRKIKMQQHEKEKTHVEQHTNLKLGLV